MKRCIGVFLLTVLLAGGCSRKENDPCEFDECSVQAPESEIATLEAYLAAENITATKHCSGVYYTINSQGVGPKPGICSSVTTYYKGSLIDGSVFEETTGALPSFYLFRVITGWQATLPLLQKGGSITLYIPPSLGYGPNAQPSIPANSILIFEIDLLDVR